MLIKGKQQPRVEIYNNHDLAMSCIDAGCSASLTTHITALCFLSDHRDPAAQGFLQDKHLKLKWKEPNSREQKQK